MTDLRDRFHALDDLRAPDLWREVQGRAAAVPQRPVRALRWVIILVTLLMALAVGGALLIGSGVIKLPVSVDATPSGTPRASSPPNLPGRWDVTTGMLAARGGHAATLLLDGSVLVTGGTNRDPRETAERFDPVARAWTDTGPLVAPGHLCGATLLADGRVLAMGQAAGQGVWGASAAQIYDPSTNAWTATGGLLDEGNGCVATRLKDGRVLVEGGLTNGPTDVPVIVATAQLYDPESGTWSLTGSLTTPRYSHTATLLLDGRVLVVGGSDSVEPNSGDDLATAEIYDPVTGVWAPTGSLSDIRFGHTATLLLDGRVLVAGRYPSGGLDQRILNSAELYDPADGTWTVTGAMTDPRGGHTATLLPDGTVLVAGGFSDGSKVLAAAERFDPGSGTWSPAGEMSGVRYRQAAVLLPNMSAITSGELVQLGPTVLVVGGKDTFADHWVSSVELYIPGSGISEPSPTPVSSASFHSTCTRSDPADSGAALVTCTGSGTGVTEAFELPAGRYTIEGDVLTGVCGSVFGFEPFLHEEEYVQEPRPSGYPFQRRLVDLAGGQYRWRIQSCEYWTATVSAP